MKTQVLQSWKTHKISIFSCDLAIAFSTFLHAQIHKKTFGKGHRSYIKFDQKSATQSVGKKYANKSQQKVKIYQGSEKLVLLRETSV